MIIELFDMDLSEEVRNYSALSLGEREFLLTESLVSEKLNSDNILLLLDEIDSFYHPDWSKELINNLIQIISKKNKVHVIITSHSPFILSDLPKENIIFLEKGKQVYPFDDGKQTFGANIHTLLSHGFFMKDGLMGEFAKDKIDTAIKYLNQKVLTPIELDYCENIISIIGEPIIKRQLQKMLDSKRLSEIDVIKKQIAELQHELAKKENKK
jgi:ABC-type multidrug transport system ATPase subunit